VLSLAHQLVDAGARGSDLAAVFEAAGDASMAEPSGSGAAAQAAQLYAQAVAAGADPAS
jgi:hypothetical protein